MNTQEPMLPPSTPYSSTARQGRLRARPVTTRPTSAAVAGTYPLETGVRRDGLLYVPTSYSVDHPARLVLLLHGAGGNAEGGISLLQAHADASNLILLAPDSHAETWDVMRGGYGPDVAVIDRLLEQAFSRYAIDPSHVAIGGFSDGASYALSLGLTNGDLFTHIIAFSPGFMSPARYEGSPRIYISHGTRDNVLPIDRCSRRIVPQLESADYDVTYHEFDGPHTVPPEIANEGVEWFLEATP